MTSTSLYLGRALKPRRRPRQLETHAAILIGASAAALAACAKVGEDVFNHESGPFDEPIRSWVLKHQNATLEKLFLVITTAGSPAVIIPCTAALAGWLWKERGRSIAGTMILSPAAAVAIFLAVKRVYRRARPAGASGFTS